VYAESQNGAVSRVNPTTGESKSIRPRDTTGDALRWDWNTPISLSPHDPKTIYVAANKLFISKDRGDHWVGTKDLTRGLDRNKLPIMGREVTKAVMSSGDGENGFSEIVTVEESPAQKGVLWVGVDDGNLQLSKDGGATWENFNGKIPGLPKDTFVSRVVPSRFAAGRCYVTFDGHRSDDFTPYIYVTEDFGPTLGVWGVDSGPFIVLPLLGPTNTRDIVGKGGDVALNPLNYPQFENDDAIRLGAMALGGVNARENAIETFDELRQQIDPYTTLRRLYGRTRAADIGIPHDEPNDAPELTDDELDF
jgi:hypothetical protein